MGCWLERQAYAGILMLMEDNPHEIGEGIAISSH
jgi:hypothetical protein